MRKILILLLGFLFCFANGFAHDHNLATYTVFNTGGTWVIRIDFPTSAIDGSLKKVYGEELDDLTEQAYKEAIVKYFKETIHLQVDGATPVELGAGGIKVGGHASTAIFTLNAFHELWSSLRCELTCFADNPKQSNLIRIEMAKDHLYKKFLRAENQFQTTFEQRARVEIKPEG